MAAVNDHSADAWGLVRKQHGVISHAQLVRLGFGEAAIRHRVARGRLHRVGYGVYLVGRPELSRHGRWMAAVLACGAEAVLSHGSAAALWGFGRERRGLIDVSAIAFSRHRHPGLVAHRRSLPERDRTEHEGIPVTSVVCTLVDRAASLDRIGIEREVSEADKLRLVTPPALRRALGDYRGQRGVGRLREALDRRTFRLTDSDLERYFLPIVRRFGLPLPLTRRMVNEFKVDFFWPDVKLVVETDGLTYHRTPAQQAKDLVREQVHMAAGYAPLRFTHEQVRYEPDHVGRTLGEVARRLGLAPRRPDEPAK